MPPQTAEVSVVVPVQSPASGRRTSPERGSCGSSSLPSQGQAWAMSFWDRGGAWRWKGREHEEQIDVLWGLERDGVGTCEKKSLREPKSREVWAWEGINM